MNIEKLVKAISLFAREPKTILAKLTWPVFSFSSYIMLSSLKKQRIELNTIIDVGANVGQFAVASAKLFPNATIHSFEPDPTCFAKLKDRTRSLSNICVHQYAIGDNDSELDFFVNTSALTGSLLQLDKGHLEAFPSVKPLGSIRVPVKRLDGILGPDSLRQPVLLKLDIQGYEPKAVVGAGQLLDHVDYVLLEVSFKSMYKDELTFNEIIPFMDSLGFQFLRPLDMLNADDTGEIVQMDALFKRKT